MKRKNMKFIGWLVSGGMVAGLFFSHKDHEHTHQETGGYLTEIHADHSAIYTSTDLSPYFTIDDTE